MKHESWGKKKRHRDEEEEERNITRSYFIISQAGKSSKVTTIQKDNIETKFALLA